jgi:hypothetical protein
MSLNTMSKRMTLEIPNLSDIYARTLLDEALGVIEDEQMWSFQASEANWITPGLLFPSTNAAVANSAGTVTVVIGSTQVIGDATASAAWAAYVASNPFAALTVCQFRSPYFSLYNIVDYNTTANPPFGTLTLDRVWGEPAGTKQPYMIYQAYFPAPVSAVVNAGITQVSVNNFKRFTDVRDTTNNYPLDYWSKSQKDLAFEDPQRTVFTDPAYVVPYKIDTRINPNTLPLPTPSPTFGYMLYELWPHPLSILPYSYHYIYRGPRLQNPNDTVPYPLTEEVVIEQARVQGYLWKEANKGENVERGAGADYKFLAQAAEKVYQRKIKPIKITDAGLLELYMNKFRRSFDSGSDDGYGTTNSGLNIGRM